MKALLKFILFCYLFQRYLFEICKIVDHNFYLIALKKNENESIGLNKYNYSLILESNPFSENDNYHLIFSVTFPVNINIELSPEIVYKFSSSKKFCIKDLIDKTQENIVGKLIEYNSGIQILKNVWIKILDINLYQQSNDNEKSRSYYFFEKNTVKYTEKYLFLKKTTRNNFKHYYQIVRLNINSKDEFLQNLKNGTEFTVQFPSNDEILRKDLTYKTFASDGTTMKNYEFIEIENLVCLYFQGKDLKGKCFDNKSINKKITYL